MRDANFVGPAVSQASRTVLHWGSKLREVCGARMETGRDTRDAAKMALSSSALKATKNDGPRDRPTRRCGEARGFRTVLGRVGARNCPASRAVSRFARWRGAPAVRDRGTRRGDQRAPPAVFSLSMLARGRSATCRLPRATGRRGSVLATVREALSDVDVKARRLLLTVVLPPPPLSQNLAGPAARFLHLWN